MPDRDADDDIADADYDTFGPAWWRVLDNNPEWIVTAALLLGAIPFFWSN